MPALIHFEIHADDPARAIRFYSRVLGWQFTSLGETSSYWRIRTRSSGDEGIGGGLLPRRGPPPREGQPVNAFVCTVEVTSLSDTLEKVVKEGGTVAVPPMALPGMGWLAYIKDTEGNILGLTENDETAE